jgi:amino acid adenylation domain-containing protein
MESVDISIEIPLFHALEKFSKNSDLSLYIVLLTAVKLLIYRYTASNDITVISPVFKPKISGETFNRLVYIRDIMEDDVTFIQWLMQIRTSVLDAYEHQDYPSDKLLSYLFDTPDDGHQPLVSNILCLLTGIHDAHAAGDVEDGLAFMFTRQENRLQGQLTYSTRLYEADYIRMMARHFHRVLDICLADVHTSVPRVSLLSKEEKEQFIASANGASGAYPREKTIARLFEEQVARTPDRVAVRHGRYTLTYRQLNRSAGQLARHLRRQGIQPNTMVGLMSEHSPEVLIAILAVLKAGGAYVPIDPDAPRERILAILKDCKAQLLLTRTSTLVNHSYMALQGYHSRTPDIHLTPRRPQITQLDELPFPDRSMVDYEKYTRLIGHAMVKYSISIQATRGCPYKCVYCHKIWPKTHIVRSAENIFEEVHQLYKIGVRRFTIIDDIFNFNVKNSSRFFQAIVDHGLQLHLFFPNGMRGDILNRDYIDLMVKAGTIAVSLALETNSPRLQKMVGKHLNLKRLKENIQYICEAHPHVILELNTMLGFPTETEEEAGMTLDFIKSIKWIHFPYLNILKIFPGTDMAELAMKNGVTAEQIARSEDCAYHELPETLPFDKSFTIEYQADFLNNYFLSKERLLHVLPHQLNVLTEDELAQKYDSYLPADIKSLDALLEFTGISREELGEVTFRDENYNTVPQFNNGLRSIYGRHQPGPGALKILLLDLSQFFSAESQMLYDVSEPPLGLMTLMTYIQHQFAGKVNGKIAKSRIDFDNYHQLKTLVRDFDPHIIGIRTLTFYKDFFHKTVALLRQWGFHMPIIAGGPYATSGYRTILKDPHVDLVVMGEGEVTFTRLIEEVIRHEGKLPAEDRLREIPGLAYVKGKQQARQETGREILMLDQWTGDPAEENDPGLEPVNRPTDLAYVLFTSGSTGKPKGVMIPHQALVNYIWWAAGHYVKNQPMDFPLYTSIGFDLTVTSIFTPLITGNTLHIVDGENKELLIRSVIRDHPAGVVKLTPAHLRLIREMDGLPDSTTSGQESSFSHVKRFIVGGEALESQLANDITNAFGQDLEIYNEYGPTEATVGCMIYRYNPERDHRYSVPIGGPIDNARIYLLDAGLSPVPFGVIGELYIAGDCLALGYLNRPALTGEVFVPNPFIPGHKMYRTGDLARRLKDGTIEFLGRSDHQVKIRGYRIEPGEIENRLMAHHDVKAAVVVPSQFGEPQARSNNSHGGDTFLCAYVVPRREIDAAELKEYLGRQLPDYMIPLSFMPIKEIPLTRNGKLDRGALPRPRFNLESDYAAPEDEIEKQMAKVWADVLQLNMETISIDANFFELGGHSLKATTLASRLHKEFNVKVPITEIFISRTIRELSRYIKNASTQRFASIGKAEPKPFYPLSSAQKRLYFLYQMEPESTAYNMPQVIPLARDIGLDRLENAFKELVNRHETFRTSFEMMGDAPVQRIHPQIPLNIQIYETGNDTQAADANSLEDITAAFIRPFDLGRPPLLRVGIVKRLDFPQTLMIDMHHIVSDGESMQVLTREFWDLYNGNPLEPLKFQYKDYSEWLNGSARQEAVRQQESYWLHHFSDQLPLLDLPADYPRPEIKRFEGRIASFMFDQADTRSLKDLAHETGATLYMCLLAIFNVLLAKLSGQDDIIVGAPVAGRPHADLEHIIGMFLNTLPMRNYPEGHKTFETFLREVKANTLGAFENQEYQFEDLVEAVSTRRDTSRNPIFDVMFNMVEQAGYREYSGANHFEPDFSQHIKANTKLDIDLRAEEREGRLLINLSYSTHLFKPETIDRIIRYFREITGAVIANPAVHINDIQVIDPTLAVEKTGFFNEKLDYNLEYDTIQERLKESFRQHPDRTAIEYGRRRLTYRELEECSHAVSTWIAQNNIEAGSFIAIYMEDRADIIAVMTGILEARCGFLPLDTTLPPQRIRHMIRQVGPGAVFTDETHRDTIFGDVEDSLNPIPTAVVDTSFYMANPPVPGNETPGRYDGDDRVYVYFTSGSSGVPKAIVGKNRGLLQFVQWEIETFGITPGFRVSQLAAVGFDAFLRNVFTPLCAGAAVCIPSQDKMILEPAALTRWIGDNRISLIHCVPSVFRVFNGGHLSEDHFRDLKYVVMSGEPVHPPELARWYRLFDDRIQLVNCYGATETTVIKTCYFIRKEDVQRVRIPIGRAIDGARVLLLDENLNVRDRGLAGEIYVRTPYSTYGYLDDHRLNAQRFIPNPFGTSDTDIIYKTGDLGRETENGEIELLGRLDGQVKLRGIRIELGEIESQLLRRQDIQKAVALVSGSGNNQVLCAYIVSGKEIPPSELRTGLSRHLPQYMVPAHFIPVAEIPLTPNGKIDRKALPAPVIAIADGTRLPANEAERKLASIWAEVLGMDEDKIGMETNFFELGGHSLKSIQLLAEIHKQMGKRVRLTEFFKEPTIRALAHHIEDAGEDDYSAVTSAETREYYPLSSAQKRIYVMQQMNPDSTAYNMSRMIHLPGAPDAAKLEETARKLIRRHESLRTAVAIVNGEPVQIIKDAVEFSMEHHRAKEHEIEREMQRFVRAFDLSAAPLFRMGIVDTGEHAVLMTDIHHLVSDGISSELLVQDYLVLLEQKELPPLKLQYKDFSQWQTAAAGNSFLKSQETYWLNQFSGDLPVLNITTDFPRPEMQSLEGGSFRFEIGGEQAAALAAMIKSRQVTLFMLMLALYNIFLHKLGGDEDIVVGTPIAGRRHPDLREIIGMFINTLALRNYPAPEKSFSQFLEEVKESTLAAFENQDYQFEELIEKVLTSRDAGRNPLFGAVLIVFNYMEKDEMAAGNASPESENQAPQKTAYERRTTVNDIVFQFVETPGTISGVITYSTQLFKQETIERFVRYFKDIISSVTRDEHVKVGDIQLRHQLDAAQSVVTDLDFDL